MEKRLIESDHLDAAVVVSGDRRRRGGSFEGKCRPNASHCNQWGLCGVVILCHEGWRRGSSRITLGFLVSVGLILFSQ